MNTIYKEVLPSTMGRHRINLKGENVQILSVAEQHNQICVWYQTDGKSNLTPVEFVINWTGQPRFDYPEDIFLGTVLLFGGSLVNHVYFGRMLSEDF